MCFCWPRALWLSHHLRSKCTRSGSKCTKLCLEYYYGYQGADGCSAGGETPPPTSTRLQCDFRIKGREARRLAPGFKTCRQWLATCTRSRLKCAKAGIHFPIGPEKGGTTREEMERKWRGIGPEMERNDERTTRDASVCNLCI